MSKPISDLTYKIVALSEPQQFDTNDCIDWAVEMIELGYESPTLYMLASFYKPTNYAEVIDYVKEAVKELGLEMKTGKEAILSYASYYVHQIAKGEKVRENLNKLYACSQQEIREEDFLFDFCLLYWAWDDYDDNYDHSPYWDKEEGENFEKVVIEKAKEWIEQNKKHYALSI